MRIERIDTFRFPVPFKQVFRHASASRAMAENVIVAVHSSDGAVGYGEGCPRTYVTGESIASAHEFITRHQESISQRVTSLDDLRRWIADHTADIDASPAAFCAIELALLDLLGHSEGRSLEALLGLPPLAGAFQYSAVLGDSHRLIYWLQLRRYWNAGFRDFKIKVSGNRARDQRKIAGIRRRGDTTARVRLDANNLWTAPQDCIAALKDLSFPLFAVEEPLVADDLVGFAAVARACDTRIILDESMQRTDQLDDLGDPGLWIVNLRVSKMGGLLRSLALASELARRGIGVIVGAQVGETSLLTRAGLAIAHAARENLIAMEGAFGTHLLARDLTTPCLMFGDAGMLIAENYLDRAAAGLGLAVNADDLSSNLR
jgi:L-alanine-DL-glutamate epimerase-like enolase superfamily enzyme